MRTRLTLLFLAAVLALTAGAVPALAAADKGGNHSPGGSGSDHGPGDNSGSGSGSSGPGSGDDHGAGGSDDEGEDRSVARTPSSDPGSPAHQATPPERPTAAPSSERETGPGRLSTTPTTAVAGVVGGALLLAAMVAAGFRARARLGRLGQP